MQTFCRLTRKIKGAYNGGKGFFSTVFLLGFVLWIFCSFRLRQQRLSNETENVTFMDVSVWRGIESSKLAFVFSALGVFENLELFKCLMAMESLSKVGSWKGDIYFLVGSTRYIPSNIQQILETGNIHVIKVDEISPSYFFYESSNEVRMLNKMKIIDYVKSAAETIVYYDCDVLFVNKGCVQTMIDNIPPLSQQYPIAISGGCHIGSFVVDRRYSKEALHAWGSALSTALDSKEARKHWIPDYQAFCELFGDDTSTKPFKFLYYDEIFKDKFAANFTSPPSELSKCVLHVSNGRCEHYGGATVHRFVKSMNLVSYNMAHRSYCPSVLRRKIKTSGINWPILQYLPSYVLNNYEVKNLDHPD